MTWFLKGDDWWKEPVAFYLGSAEGPLEARAWLNDAIGHVAERIGTGGDFGRRAQFLVETLSEAFPGCQAQ